MSDITISYKGSSIATMDATGTKTLLTEGKYCEDDITLAYTKPSGGGGYDWSWVKDDGNTYLYINVGEYWKEFRLRYYQTTTGAVTVDWGDGNTETTTTKDHHILTHTYATAGDYTIRIIPTNNNLAFYSHINNGSAASDRHYNDMLIKAEIGHVSLQSNALLAQCRFLEALAYNNTDAIHNSTQTGFGGGLVSLRHYKQKEMSIILSVQDSLLEEIPYFQNATRIGVCTGNRALKTARIPKSIVGFGTNQFQDCWTLESCTFDTPVNGNVDYTSLPNGCFTRCYHLQEITIPEGVQTLGNNFFYGCDGLKYISLPSTLTQIDTGWNDCGSVKELHIAATTPPSINSGLFNAFPSDAVIYVPYSADHSVLNVYQNASNWTAYSSKMQEEPQT